MGINFTLGDNGGARIEEVGPWPSLVASHRATCHGDNFVNSILMLNRVTHDTASLCSGLYYHHVAPH